MRPGGGAKPDAIAAAAGVNKALRYYYFQSRRALPGGRGLGNCGQFQQQARGSTFGEGRGGAHPLRYVSYHFDFIGTHPIILAFFTDDDGR